MRRLGFAAGCLVLICSFMVRSARTQEVRYGASAPLPGYHGVGENVAAFTDPGLSHMQPQYQERDLSRVQYGNAPFPRMQHEPHPATTPERYMAYPGQVPAVTLGGSPWPHDKVASSGQFAAPAPQSVVSREIEAERRRLMLEEHQEIQGAVKKAQGSSPTLFGTVDMLYWQLRRRDLDYGISSLPGALVISGGEIHELEHPSDAGFRTVLGYELATGWQVGFGFMMFDSGAAGSAVDGAGTLYATRSHPDMNRRAGVAEAESSFDMRILDLEVRNSLQLGDRAELSLFGSFRWADISQGFQVDYDEIEFPVGGTVTSQLGTTAFGIRIGADGKWSLTPGLYLVGTGETSILFSENSLSLKETQGTNTIVDLADGYEQALPVIGTRVGAGYEKGPLSLEMGYEIQAWFDLGDRMSFLDDQHLGVFSHSNHNVLLDGYYLRLAWER